MITGWKKLSASERRHLKEQRIHTDQDWDKTVEHQTRMRAMGGIEPCWDCRRIELKLKN